MELSSSTEVPERRSKEELSATQDGLADADGHAGDDKGGFPLVLLTCIDAVQSQTKPGSTPSPLLIFSGVASRFSSGRDAQGRRRPSPMLLHVT